MLVLRIPIEFGRSVMVNASDVYNLVHYEVVKVADKLQEVVIFVWIISHTFLILPLQEYKFRFSIS